MLKTVRDSGGTPGEPPRFGFGVSGNLEAYVFELAAPDKGVSLGRLEPPRPYYPFTWF